MNLLIWLNKMLCSLIKCCHVCFYTYAIFFSCVLWLYYSCQKGHSPIRFYCDKEFCLEFIHFYYVSYTYTIHKVRGVNIHTSTLASIVVTLYDNDFPCEFVYLMWMYNTTTYLSLAQRYFYIRISGLNFIMR